MKKTIILFIVLAMLIGSLALCFTSCSGGIDTDAAKEHILNFLREVKDGDFRGAEEYMHPSITDNIKTFFNDVEDEKDVNFQSGITVLQYTNVYTALYDTEIDGSGYELTMNIEVSGKVLEIIVVVVDNDEGYGVYYIEIDD